MKAPCWSMYIFMRYVNLETSEKKPLFDFLSVVKGHCNEFISNVTVFLKKIFDMYNVLLMQM